MSLEYIHTYAEMDGWKCSDDWLPPWWFCATLPRWLSQHRTTSRFWYLSISLAFRWVFCVITIDNRRTEQMKTTTNEKQTQRTDEAVFYRSLSRLRMLAPSEPLLVVICSTEWPYSCHTVIWIFYQICWKRRWHEINNEHETMNKVLDSRLRDSTLLVKDNLAPGD